ARVPPPPLRAPGANACPWRSWCASSSRWWPATGPCPSSAGLAGLLLGGAGQEAPAAHGEEGAGHGGVAGHEQVFASPGLCPFPLEEPRALRPQGPGGLLPPSRIPQAVPLQRGHHGVPHQPGRALHPPRQLEPAELPGGLVGRGDLPGGGRHPAPAALADLQLPDERDRGCAGERLLPRAAAPRGEHGDQAEQPALPGPRGAAAGSLPPAAGTRSPAASRGKLGPKPAAIPRLQPGEPGGVPAHPSLVCICSAPRPGESWLPQRCLCRPQVLRLLNVIWSPKVSPRAAPAAPGFPQLEELCLATTSYSFVSDGVLQRILHASAQLRVLDLRGCSRVTPQGLQALPCPDLEQLHLGLYSSASELLRPARGSALLTWKWRHSLRDLDLAGQSFSERDLEQALAAFAQGTARAALRSLNLTGTKVTLGTVSALLLGCPTLTYLNLSSCRYLPRGMKKAYRGPDDVRQCLQRLLTAAAEPAARDAT
uniref:F-box and leucine rich repeat protein 6 n=1 Tax=Apteryx owenii TaxID=8824 RepID=A0A8B9P4F3_APTOW